MKKLIYILLFVCVIALAGCTPNEVTKEYGGTRNIEVPKGYKVTGCNWKNQDDGGSDLWYFVEEMEDGYVPKTKKFIESSNWGVFNGEVIFHESR
jgi:hypothetical protein